ncbi:CPBP family intramembrane metalloprotease [Bacillus sp. COPE52]|nr:CPBP family intramembrane metalloprotease [Bacillus sp. COPE52]
MTSLSIPNFVIFIIRFTVIIFLYKIFFLFIKSIFAAVHFDWFFFHYFVNGCLFARSYEKTGDIIVPIVAHISFNSFLFLAISL